MTRSASVRFVPRSLLLLAGCLSLAVAGAVATGAGSAGAKANQPASSQWGAAVALAAPSAGDVSYGVVRVRIARGAKLLLPSGLAGERTIFSSRIGGLSIRAGSAQWRSLRASTHVYVVVAAVPGAGASVRDVALFVVRRKARGGPPRAQVTFTVANARALVGSFWVHGVDRHGYANVFKARNILSTALTNWSRYARALQVADAVRAAMNPRVQGPASTASASRARSRLPGPWTGGQRPDARVLAMYRLLAGALHDPTAYGALKHNSLVPDFIATELSNPPLAARWRAVVAQVPVTVPDQFAALAQEEKRFAHVTRPRLSHAVVAFDVNANSTTVIGNDAPGSTLQYLTIEIPSGAGSGSVTFVALYVNGSGSPVYTCTNSCNYGFPLDAHGQPSVSRVALVAEPGGSSALSDWSGCVPSEQIYCTLEMSPGDHTVRADFVAGYELTVAVNPTLSQGGYNQVTTSPAGIACGPDGDGTCDAQFPDGSPVTLTAAPAAGQALSSWTGCDQVSGNACTVTASRLRDVTANFAPATYPLTVTVNTFNPQHTGTVTSNPGGISCDVGQVCSAPFGRGSTVMLTAVPNGGGFDLWQGCDQTAGYTCTVTMSQAKNVTATFG
ncbi:MAG: hypothetical protein M3076_10960 [Actinomycetota bacterium]|nr:hypothetical protein [Actinomycetota bacterium]